MERTKVFALRIIRLYSVLLKKTEDYYHASVAHHLSSIIHLSSFIIFLSLFLCSKYVHADLSARLERDHIAEGESVQLQIESDAQVSGQPDTSPLEKAFDLLGITSGSSINIVNGRMKARTTWTISLSPKRSGKLTIPALEINGERTQPLTLIVSDAPVAASATDGHPIFIETEVDRRDPYVQGMVRYTVRLFHAVRLAKGSLSEPQPDNALVRRLGQDSKYTVEREGRRYQVIERQYAIFPQASGKLTLPAPVLDAHVTDKRKKRRSPFQDFFGRDPFDDSFMFSSTRPVRVRGEEKVLTVRPRPDQVSDSRWLPAETVVLIEQWQPESGEVRAGDPLTRTITIRARGVTGEQLPNLEPGSVDGFKIYPDKAQAETRDLDENVEGEKSLSIAYVPIRPGGFNLPAIRLHWWDTQTNQERVAELPEHRIEVLPAADAQAATVQSTPKLKNIPEKDAPTPGSEAGVSANRPATADAPPFHPGFWPWISLLFALLWLATLVIWWLSRDRLSRSRGILTEDKTAAGRAGDAKKQFRAACRANDPKLARRYLLEWAADHWRDDPPGGLEDLARRLDEGTLRAALADLDQTLFSGGDQAWDGSRLAAKLTSLPGSGKKRKESYTLPDLYPKNV